MNKKKVIFVVTFLNETNADGDYAIQNENRNTATSSWSYGEFHIYSTVLSKSMCAIYSRESF